jgi:hypothetical protein
VGRAVPEPSKTGNGECCTSTWNDAIRQTWSCRGLEIKTSIPILSSSSVIHIHAIQAMAKTTLMVRETRRPLRRKRDRSRDIGMHIAQL